MKLQGNNSVKKQNSPLVTGRTIARWEWFVGFMTEVSFMEGFEMGTLSVLLGNFSHAWGQQERKRQGLY